MCAAPRWGVVRTDSTVCGIMRITLTEHHKRTLRAPIKVMLKSLRWICIVSLNRSYKGAEGGTKKQTKTKQKNSFINW